MKERQKSNDNGQAGDRKHYDDNSSLLGCYTVLLGHRFPTFRKTVSPSPSGVEDEGGRLSRNFVDLKQVAQQILCCPCRAPSYNSHIR